jgi:hypothetical protein
MGDIYRKASRVITFLGNESDDFALETLTALGKSMNFEEETAENFLRLLQDFTKSEAVYRIAKLLCNPYWTRAWIAQEIALSNQDAVTIWGLRCFNTQDILSSGARSRYAFDLIKEVMDVRRVLRNPSDWNSPVISLESFMQGFRRLQNFAAVRNYNEQADNPTSYNTLWFRIPSQSEVTDSRDLLYGTASVFPRKLMSLLRVDYSEEWKLQHVMTDFAVAHVKTFRSLNWILFRPWVPFASWKSWPSWVPNLAIEFSLDRCWFHGGIFSRRQIVLKLRGKNRSKKSQTNLTKETQPKN